MIPLTSTAADLSDSSASEQEVPDHGIVNMINELMASGRNPKIRTFDDLAAALDLNVRSLHYMKNGGGAGIKHSTMGKLCRIFRCQPGDILKYVGPTDDDEDDSSGPAEN